jgi:hypothetical protein
MLTLTEEAGSLFLTDSVSYSFTREAGIFVLALGATLTNRLEYPLYVRRCYESALRAVDKRVEGAWETAYEPDCDLGGYNLATVHPGQTYRDTTTIAIGPWLPRFSAREISGTYRARYEIYDEYPTDTSQEVSRGSLATERARVTNVFTIRGVTP